MEPAGQTISGCPWPLAIVLFVGLIVLFIMSQVFERDHLRDQLKLRDEILQLNLRLVAAGAIIRRHYPTKYVDPDEMIDKEMIVLEQYGKEKVQ